jgi:hypothetical protein
MPCGAPLFGRRPYQTESFEVAFAIAKPRAAAPVSMPAFLSALSAPRKIRRLVCGVSSTTISVLSRFMVILLVGLVSIIVHVNSANLKKKRILADPPFEAHLLRLISRTKIQIIHRPPVNVTIMTSNRKLPNPYLFIDLVLSLVLILIHVNYAIKIPCFNGEASVWLSNGFKHVLQYHDSFLF